MHQGGGGGGGGVTVTLGLQSNGVCSPQMWQIDNWNQSMKNQSRVFAFISFLIQLKPAISNPSQWKRKIVEDIGSSKQPIVNA